MSESRLGALVALALGVCCGLPLLLGAGVLGAASGIALGSTAAVAVCLALGALGFVRFRRPRAGRAQQNDRQTSI